MDVQDERCASRKRSFHFQVLCRAESLLTKPMTPFSTQFKQHEISPTSFRYTRVNWASGRTEMLTQTCVI